MNNTSHINLYRLALALTIADSPQAISMSVLIYRWGIQSAHDIAAAAGQYDAAAAIGILLDKVTLFDQAVSNSVNEPGSDKDLALVKEIAFWYVNGGDNAQA